jgi:hypothetical protein
MAQRQSPGAAGTRIERTPGAAFFVHRDHAPSSPRLMRSTNVGGHIIDYKQYIGISSA